MSAVIFALLLVATALGLERYSTVHSLDDVQGRLEVEDYLVEAGEPAVIHLVVRNSGPRWKMFLAAKLHLNKEFLPCAEHHITQDQAGLGHTVRFTTWLRPGQEADFSTALRLERRGRYVLEPMQVIGGDFLGLVEQSRTERGFHELIVPPRECALPELEEMLGGFLGELSVNRYLYEDPILTAGYRPYTSGDPMRSIAWKQSVRGQGLMVKKWDYTTEPRAVVLVHADTKDYDHPEPAELCYSMARTVCRRLEEKAVSYRFAANAAFDLLLNAALSGEEWRKPLETPQGYGPEHYRRVLEILGRATGQTALSCARFCAEYYHPQEQVWPALCFGLASCFEGSRPLRTTLAALSAAALLFLPTGADKLCYFPAAVYPVLLAYTGDFALSPVRQAERLRWLCRVWPFFAVAMLLWNANAVLSAALPFATAAAVLLVGFNRTTRQDPEISTRPGYLLLSGGVLAVVCAGPFLLSRSVVVAGAKAAASAVYFGGIVPVLQLFLNNIVVQGVTWLFHGILQFIHWLFTLFPPKPLERTEIVSTDEVIANAQKAAENAEPLIDGMSMLTVLGILLAVLCAVLVVRHFLRQKFRHTDTACMDTTVRRSTHKRARRWPGLFLSPVDKVRREYAIYLDHCQRHGVTILRGDTSLDLTGRAFGMDFAAEAELRQIYLKARYNGTATAEDAARAAELVRKICS